LTPAPFPVLIGDPQSVLVRLEGSMVKPASVRLGVALVLGGALLSCGAREDKEEAVTQIRSALTNNLFSPYVTYAGGARPQAVAIGDLDGDGRNDVALLSSYAASPATENVVSVYIQASNGTLNPQVQYPLTLGLPRSLDIGDVNGDGRADVVVGNEFGAGSAVQVLLQNASGTLDPLVSYPTLSGSHVKIGDFDGDGRMDVAALQKGYDGNGLDVFLQTGTGSLASPVTYQVPHGPGEELEVGDVNGDGRTDLIVSPVVSVLLQNTDGTMAAPVAYSLGSGVVPYAIGVGDSNGDGRADVVAAYGDNRPNSFIARLLQNAQGTLNPAVSYASLDSPGPTVVADIDGDGRKDVLVVHNSMAKLGVYRQAASGEFVFWSQEFGPSGLEQQYSIPGATWYAPQALAVGDINNDGLPDVAIADYNVGLVVLRHINDPDPTVTLTAPAPGTYFGNVPMTVTWTASDDAVGFALYVSFDAGAHYNPIQGCTFVPAAGRSCTWTPSLPATGMRLRVNTWDAASNTNFSETTINIATATLTVTGPPGQPLPVGAPTTITWTSNLPASTTMRVELTRNSGTSWETLATDAPNTGSFPWTVTGPTTPLARVRVTSNGPVIATSLGATFQIVTASMTVTAPAAGATVLVGDSMIVNWTSQNVPFGTTVRVELSRDGGASYAVLMSPVNNFGFVTVNVAGPATTNAIVRVAANGAVPASGTSGVFTIASPSVTVTSPGGGTSFVGTTLPITWTTNLPASATMRVDVTRDGGGTFTTVAASVPNTGSFAWTVAGPDAAAARIRVSSNAQATFATGQSGDFAIVTPAVTVTAPAEAASLFAGTAQVIAWSSNLPASATALIELSRDGGATFEALGDVPNTGSFAWAVTGPDTAAGRVRVTVSDAVTASGTSGGFAIVTPALSVTAPAEGASLFAGTAQTIAWSSNLPAGATALIELTRDGGATFETLAAAAPNTGSFAWTVAGPDTAAAQVRVTLSGPASASATGGAFGIVTPIATVTAPAAGASLLAGTATTIAWSSNLPAGGTALIELSRNGGSTFETLAAAAPNTGSFAWTVTGPATAAALVSVTVSGGASATGISGTFAIVNATLAVTAPAASASWTIGTARTITWTSNLPPSGTVRIELSRDNGVSYTSLTTSAPNNGSFAWTATGATTTSAFVRVSANGTPAASAVSGKFSLVAATLTVTSPNTLVTWLVSSVHAITWTHNVGAGATFKIEVSRNSGSTWSQITAAAPGGATSGSYNWTVTSPRSDTSRIRVTWTGNTSVKDTSNVNFRIR